MGVANGRFFIALLPSQAIQDDANTVKQVFADRYDSRAALKSPPHITLQPPFEWSLDALPALNESLSEFATQSAPLPIALSGFGAFPPRVISINVIKTPDLLALQAALIAHMERALGIVNAEAKTRSFAPHMTVGFRDLTKENFNLAWAEFQHRPLQLEFTATHLTLLQNDGQRWTVSSEFPFLGMQ
ncbi:2'-5' RNA ligase family protein [Stenomitos frigidus]|uniref:2'-5' RNA ligase n=1 Tax=Stenomitos frigidus ULC18 TaxID=2107698 RepID=A0A2T1ELT4_9CYAN|nr:2'-5' RNA ligase family protein [Stenomitos frigidus]PSB33671.1 2'-5' RNA ligase [Stenomitos frigidus ULC18]